MKAIAKRALRGTIVWRPTRWLLNRIYLLLGWRGASLFYARTAKIFRDAKVGPLRDTWTVKLAGLKVRLPLTGERMWLDWDQAVSVIGHEPAVKRAYAQLLTRMTRPDLFVDVGTNYGTHSLLFLAAGVVTLSFEPNDACHAYFREACAANGFVANIEPIALGDTPGHIELSFPVGQTWLGSIEPGVVERLRAAGSLETRRVEVRRLDSYVEAFAGKRVLVKIDAEGHELAILRGAHEVLSRHRPTVIFESLPASDRAAVADLFAREGYDLTLLSPDGIGPVLSRDDFVGASVSDFLAIPRGEQELPPQAVPRALSTAAPTRTAS